MPRTTLFCCHKQQVDIGSQNNPDKYDVYYDQNKDLTGGTAAIATLTKLNNIPTQHQLCNFSHCNQYSSTDQNAIDNIISTYAILPTTIDPSNTITNLHNVQVTAIGNEAFNRAYNCDELYIELPDIEYIGDNPNNENKSFNANPKKLDDQSTIVQTKMRFIVNSSTKPKIIGSTLTIANDIKVYVNDQHDYNLSNDGTPLVIANNNWGGWISAPYIITDQTGYQPRKNIRDVQYTAHAIDVTQKPFIDQLLMVSLNSSSELNNDGTTHEYNSLSGDNSVATFSNGVATFNKFTTLHTFDLSTGYDAKLTYNVGNPYVSDDNNFAMIKYENNEDFLRNCNHLIFTYTDETHVPYWNFTPATGNHGNAQNPAHLSLTTNKHGGGVEIQVKKQIDNKHFRYYSMPFDMLVSDIEVCVGTTKIYYLPQGQSIIDSITTSLTDDYFVIIEYQGQTKYDLSKGKTASESYDPATDPDCYGWATYRQVASTETIPANHAFAIVVVESDDHWNNKSTVTADITFKSAKAVHTIHRNDQQLTLTGLTCNASVPADKLTAEQRTAINDQYQGWNMVGNPFYNYVRPSIYGNQKVIYVHDEKKDNGITNKAYKAVVVDKDSIKPFKMALIQIAEKDTASLSLGTPVVCNPTYVTHTNPTSQILRSEPEEEIIDEKVCVDFYASNDDRDFVVLWNNDTSTFDFILGEDVGKLDMSSTCIFSYCDRVKAVSKRLPLRSDSTITIPIGISAEADGNYTFALDSAHHNFHGQTLLHDKNNGQYYPLDLEGTTLTLTAGLDTTGFELVVIPEELPTGLEDPVETSESLDAYVYNGRLVVENIEEGSILSIYDISGKMLYNAPAAGGFNYQFSAHGVYMVVLQGNTTGSIKVVY